MRKLKTYSKIIHTGDTAYHHYSIDDDKVFLQIKNSHYDETVQIDPKGELRIDDVLLNEFGEEVPEIKIPAIDYPCRLTAICMEEAEWLSKLIGKPIVKSENPNKIYENYNASTGMIKYTKELEEVFKKDGFKILNSLVPQHGCQLEIEKKNIRLRVWVDIMDAETEEISYDVGFLLDLMGENHFTCTSIEELVEKSDVLVDAYEKQGVTKDTYADFDKAMFGSDDDEDDDEDDEW